MTLSKKIKKIWHHYIKFCLLGMFLVSSYSFGYGIKNVETSISSEKEKTLKLIEEKKKKIKEEIKDFKKELKTSRKCLVQKVKFLSGVIVLTRRTLIERKSKLSELQKSSSILETVKTKEKEESYEE